MHMECVMVLIHSITLSRQSRNRKKVKTRENIRGKNFYKDRTGVLLITMIT